MAEYRVGKKFSLPTGQNVIITSINKDGTATIHYLDKYGNVKHIAGSLPAYKEGVPLQAALNIEEVDEDEYGLRHKYTMFSDAGDKMVYDMMFNFKTKLDNEEFADYEAIETYLDAEKEKIAAYFPEVTDTTVREAIWSVIEKLSKNKGIFKEGW